MGNSKKSVPRKVGTLTKILSVVAVFLILFIAMMCFFFYKFQEIPDVLCTCVLGTGSAELICMAIIEIVKKKYEGK